MENSSTESSMENRWIGKLQFLALQIDAVHVEDLKMFDVNLCELSDLFIQIRETPDVDAKAKSSTDVEQSRKI